MSTHPTVRDVRDWAEELDAVGQRLARRFGGRAPAPGRRVPRRPAHRRRAEERLAARRADRRRDPYGVQHLLGRADWDPDAVRDDLRAYVVEHLGDPDGVLIVDETGFLKKGTKSAGVPAAVHRHRRADRELPGRRLPAYAGRQGTRSSTARCTCPRSGPTTRTAARRRASPRTVAFATKPQLAERMLERAFTAGVPAAWVTGDEVYGGDGGCGGGWRGTAGRTSWRSGATSTSGRGRSARTGSPPWPRLPAGLAQDQCRGRAPRGRGGTPGRAGRSAAIGPTRWRRWLLVRRHLERTRGAGVLHRRRAGRTTLTRLARVAGVAVGGRGVLRVGQAGGRAGRVRGAELDGLVPAHHAVACSPRPCWRRSGGWPDPGPRRKRGPAADPVDGPGGPPAAGAAGVGPPAGGRRAWPGRSGGGRTSSTRRNATYKRRAGPVNNYNCSTNASRSAHNPA